MVRFHQTRRFAALLALASLLFLQLAVAAYACPGIDPLRIAAAADEGMQDCHGMDTAQPNLCQAHQQAGSQLLDKPPSPDIQPFVPAALQREVVVAAMRQEPRHAPPDDVVLTRATAPPHAIDHCCLRI
ncbi:hypothetical protein [Noviherbaspirillum autotrophicum]|uniref:hypothetical protein n=1 Tax=Noviherbaspirillum autotrophicum TaxID=709839 RepID=UPI000AA0A5C3|nr:hypothetical protein [Noviherbaspirillum autotrophicum]